jgi:hypothetical protein
LREKKETETSSENHPIKNSLKPNKTKVVFHFFDEAFFKFNVPFLNFETDVVKAIKVKSFLPFKVFFFI